MVSAQIQNRLGTVLGGKLRLDTVLGAGGMGAVYAATNLVLGQRVAVKLLTGGAHKDPEDRARFIREAQVAARLTSEHVARVYDLGQTESGEPYIVMELLEGEDLAQILDRERRLDVPRAVGLILQACLGVGAAHAHGLVHRDLKPANLFAAHRSAGGVLVKVLDFGLSKAEPNGSATLTRSNVTFGTPQYMAPEQIMSAKHVDARCDQHALGLILYELLTGEVAYPAPSPNAILTKIATSPAPSARAIRPSIPADLDAAIRRALAKTPSDRFPDLGAFAEAMAPFADPSERGYARAVRDALRPPARTDPNAGKPAPVGKHGLPVMPRSLSDESTVDFGEESTANLDESTPEMQETRTRLMVRAPDPAPEPRRGTSAPRLSRQDQLLIGAATVIAFLLVVVAALLTRAP